MGSRLGRRFGWVVFIGALTASGLSAQLSVVSGADYSPVVAPGSFAALFGTGLAAGTTVGSPGADGTYPKQLGGLTVTIGGAAADIVVVTPTQINLIVPTVAQYGSLGVVVASGAQTIAAGTVTVSPTAPAIFTTDASGTGFGAILNAINFTAPPFALTTQTQAAGTVTTIVAVFGTGFRYAGGATVIPQSGDVSSHVAATARNSAGQTWTLPVLYAGPVSGYEGLDQINVQLAPDIDTTSDLTLTLFTDAVPSNPVYLWLQRSPGPSITTVSPASASPGGSVTITGTGFLDASSLQASARESVFFVLPSGQQFSSQLASLADNSVEALVPVAPSGSTNAYYYGNAQICIVIDSQRSCLPNFSIAAPAATGQAVGSALLNWQQQAVKAAISSLPASTDPSLVSAIQATAQQKLSALQQQIADAVAGHPDTVQITDMQGNAYPVVFDISAIQNMESLLVGTPPPALGDIETSKRKKLSTALSETNTASCGLSSELGMVGITNAYNKTLESENFLANTLRGIADNVLHACLQGVATIGASAFSGTCLDLGAGVSYLEGLVDIAFVPFDYGVFLAQLYQEQNPIFLQSLQISPSAVSLSPSLSTRNVSITGSLVSKGYHQSTAELVNKLVSDFITSKIVDAAVAAGTTVCGPGGLDCIDLSKQCPNCIPQYYNYVDSVANYLGSKIAGAVNAGIALTPLPTAGPPQSIQLGMHSLSIDSTQAPAVSVSLACTDGDISSVVLDASTTVTAETVTFRADRGNLLLLNPSSIPTAQLGVIVNNVSPTIKADNSSYVLTDAAIINGSNFAPGTSLSLSMQGNGVSATLFASLTASANGGFQQTVLFPVGIAAGSYQIVASSSDGTQSASVSITIQASPVARFVMSGGGQTATSGGVLNLGVAQGGSVNVTFDATSSTGAIASWSWLDNGSPLSCSGSTCSYSFSSASLNNTVKLIVTSSSGQTATATGQVNLSVQSTPPGSFTLTAEAPVCGQTAPASPAVRLNWTLSGNASTYDIYRNGALDSPAGVNVAGTTFYDSVGLVAGQTYAYFVQAKNIAGNTDSNMAAVSIPLNICLATPTLQSVTIAPTTVIAGSSAAVTITLSGPAPSGGAIVSLSSNNTAFPLQSSYTIPAGQNSATLLATSSLGISATATATVTATYNGVSKTASITVTVGASNLATLTNLAVSPATVGSGGSATITVTLSGAAPTPSGAAVALSSSSPSAFPPPSTLVVQPGQTSASTTIKAGTPNSSTTVTLTASYGGSNQTATVTVSPPATSVALSSVAIAPSSLQSGGFATLSVTLNGIAPANGAAVSVQTSNSTAFPAPSSVTVPAGQSTNGVSVQAGAVTAATTVTVTATYSGASSTATLTVNPSASNQVVVTPNAWPPQFTVGDPSATLGFQVSSHSGSALSGTVAVSTNSGGSWLTVDGHQSESWVAPEGLSVTANPAALSPGVYTGSVTVTSPAASNSPVTVPVTMTILAKLQITTTSLPTGTWGQAYPSTQLQATGGNSYTWTLESGVLPSGLTLSPSGVISGTLPNANSSQSFTFNVQVTDSLNRSTYVTLTLAIQTAIIVTTNAPSSFQFNVGTTYVEPPNGANSITFQASGGTSPYSWTAAGLPTGLILDRSSGTVVGTPIQPGSFPAVITATDSQGRSGNQTFTLTVVTTPLVITTTALPSGTVGVAYSQFLNAQGGSQAGYVWNVQGILPSGITAHLPASCPAACGFQISGTPTQAGTFNLTARVTDSLQDTTQQSFILAINSATPPKIQTSSLTLATVGQAYSFPFAASGGTPPYQWSLVGASPDSGLTLSATGVLSGTSTVPNDCVTGPGFWTQYPSTTFQVQVTDAAGQSNVGQYCLPAYYPTPQVSGFTPPNIVVDGQTHTITVNGANFRASAIIYGGSGVKMTTAFASSSALSFTLVPQVGSAFSGFNEGTYPFWVVQPYSYSSNEDKTFTISDPAPAVTSAKAVLNNSTQACRANVSCQLIITGSGLVYSTQYQVTQNGPSLQVAQSPSTPIPWNTVTTSAFALAAGAYTVQVTNPGQPSATAQFTVTP